MFNHARAVVGSFLLAAVALTAAHGQDHTTESQLNQFVGDASISVSQITQWMDDLPEADQRFVAAHLIDRLQRIEKMCTAGSAPGESTAAALTRVASVLAETGRPWSLVDTPYGTVTSEKAEALYNLLACVDEWDLAAGPPYLRELRRVIEDAHANADGGLETTFTIVGEDCETHLLRARLRDRFADGHDRSVNAVRAVILEAGNYIQMSILGGCGETPSERLKAADGVLQSLFDDRVFRQSIESFRWVNDARFLQFVARLLDDASTDLSEDLATFEGSSVLLDGKLYRDAAGAYIISPFTVSLIKQYELSRKESFPKEYRYHDQVYIYEFVPGADAGLVRMMYTMPQIADGIRAAQKYVQDNCDECRDDVSRAAHVVGEFMTGNVFRDDLVVVVGSYQAESAALRASEALTKRFSGRLEFEVEQAGAFFRVRIKGTRTDQTVIELERELERERVDYFKSRPQVLTPL